MKAENVGKLCVCIDEMITDVRAGVVYSPLLCFVNQFCCTGRAGDFGRGYHK